MKEKLPLTRTERMQKLGRLLAEWNATDYAISSKKAQDVCYELTKLFPRIFHREWNKFVKERLKP